MEVRRAEGVEELTALLEQGPGVLVATHEALNPEVLGGYPRHLIDQPEWSEMPLVILLDRAAPQARVRAELSAAWPRSRQLYYQRPVTTLELLERHPVDSAGAAASTRHTRRIEREVELRRELNHR